MEKKNGKKIIAMLLMLSLLVMMLAACTQTAAKTGANGEGGYLDQIKKSGKLVLGTAADYPPYEFYAEVNGKLEVVGFDIEIAKAVAEDIGVELVIKDMKFDGLLAALVAGDIDFIVAGMVPTEERKKSVDFSQSYYQAEQHLLIKASDKDKFKSVDDLKGLIIGAQKSTIQEEIVVEQIPGANPKGLSKITDLVLELKNDKVNGVVLVGPVAAAYAKNDPTLVVSDITFGKEDGVAIAVAKGKEDFLASINSTLDRLIAEDAISKFIAEATELADQQQE